MNSTLDLRRDADFDRALLAFPNCEPQIRPARHADWLSQAVATVRAWAERSRERAQLAELDDRALADIGLTRADVLRESSKPFWR